jgi:hypothetical protein
VELPPREMLEAKLHEAIRLARGQVEWEARKPLKGDALALRKAACAPVASQEAHRLQGEAQAALARGRDPQSPGQAGGPDRVADGEIQADPEGFQDLQLLDGILARGRQDAQCASGSARKMNAEASRRKARERKAEALGYHETRD